HATTGPPSCEVIVNCIGECMGPRSLCHDADMPGRAVSRRRQAHVRRVLGIGTDGNPLRTASCNRSAVGTDCRPEIAATVLLADVRMPAYGDSASAIVQRNYLLSWL